MERLILIANPAVPFRTKTETLMKKYVFILSNSTSYDIETDLYQFQFQVGTIPATDASLANFTLFESAFQNVKLADLEDFIDLPEEFEIMTISEKQKEIVKQAFKAMAEKTKMYQFEQFDYMLDQESNLPLGPNPSE